MPQPTLTVRLTPDEAPAYRVYLDGPGIGQRHGAFTPPYDPPTWAAIRQGLEPGWTPEQADAATRAALEALGDPGRLHQSVGQALAAALLADDEVRAGFETALAAAEQARDPLPVELHLGIGCDALAALPWELVHHAGRFLVADGSIALSRYPEGEVPPTPARVDLPLRVLLVLAEPADVPPTLPRRARGELLHGLRTLDEMGAVVVDELRPPTFDALVEAVTTGGYHLLAFYGHGAHDENAGGCLVFEDEYGGPALVQARELGAALRNTAVRLVLLGACQSAQVGPFPRPPAEGASCAEETGLWAGVAPALLRAGVPLAIGMQTSMRVDAAQAFIRQFALSLAAGKPVSAAVADARRPLVQQHHAGAWFVPALYARPAGGDDRLFDPARPLPDAAGLRAQVRACRAEVAALERAIGAIGVLGQPGELAQLRAARRALAQAQSTLAQRPPGAPAPLTSPLYGVPTNPVFLGRGADLRRVAQALQGERPVVVWGPGGIGKTALAAEVAHRQGWRFPGGVLWLDCRGGPALDTLLDRVGAFCGAALDQVEPPQKPAAARAALARLDGRCLLVWDNAEDVWGDRGVRDLIQGLPPNCQGLLTTRENPHQAMWPTVELEPLADDAMLALFLDLAGAAGVKVVQAGSFSSPKKRWLSRLAAVLRAVSKPSRPASKARSLDFDNSIGARSFSG